MDDCGLLKQAEFGCFKKSKVIDGIGLAACIPNVVKLLLKKGADVNKKEAKEGITALMYATEKGHTGILKLLLDNGAEVNAKDNDGMTAIFLVTPPNPSHLEAISLLLDKGADANVKDKDGMTALALARKNGNEAVAKILEEAGGE